MKNVAVLLLAAMAAFAQQTVTITAPASMNETPVVAMFSATAIQQATQNIIQTPATTAWPNAPGQIPQSTTLTAAVDTTTTVACPAGTPSGAVCSAMPLNSVTALAYCNGLLVDAEVALVVQTTPSLIVQRGMLGSQVAAHAANAPVTVLRVGDLTCGLKAVWFDGVSQIIASRLNAVSQSQFNVQQLSNQAQANAGVQ